MKKALLPLLALVSLLSACRTPKGPDYGATRQRSDDAHQELNRQQY